MNEVLGAIGAWFAAVFTGFNDVLNGALLWALDLVRSVDPVARTLLAGLGIFLETSLLVGLLVPGDTIVIVAATAVDSPWQYIALLFAVIGGALGGESVGFALGRFFGPRIRHSRLGQRIGEKNWRRAEFYVDRRGGIAVFISRFLPVLHSLVPVTVGMSTMRYRRFLAWTTPACVIWATGYVTFGTIAGGGYRDLVSRLHGAGYIFVAGVAVSAIMVLVIKKVLERTEARHWSEPGDGDANTMEEPTPTGTPPVE
jgi:membrane protein DedA with SNARE-associated domain